MGCHGQGKAARRCPARQQKGQQTTAFPPIRQMQPRAEGQRRPAIAG
jgi:hypothetical protein